MNTENCKHYLSSRVDAWQLNEDYIYGRMPAVACEDGNISYYDLGDRNERTDDKGNIEK